ncbi:MAG: hypothetical protein J2P32_07900, partial [Actinobacteria bacterium]|nr:hypothetical protein [Actinomycetota bacterium]
LAQDEGLEAEQDELNSYVIEQAYRMGVPPDRLAKELIDRGQLGVIRAEVVRAKALTMMAERAAVTDDAGRPVDIKALAEEATRQAAGETVTADAGGGTAGDPAGDEAGGDEAGGDQAGGDETGAAARAGGEAPASDS